MVFVAAPMAIAPGCGPVEAPRVDCRGARPLVLGPRVLLLGVGESYREFSRWVDLAEKDVCDSVAILLPGHEGGDDAVYLLAPWGEDSSWSIMCMCMCMCMCVCMLI